MLSPKASIERLILTKLLLRRPCAIGGNDPNVVYRGSHGNVGFRATAITTSTSDMGRKQ